MEKELKNSANKRKNKRRLKFIDLLLLVKKVLYLVYKTAPVWFVALLVLVILDGLTPYLNRYVNSRIIDQIIETVAQTSEITPSLMQLIILSVVLTFVSNLLSRARSIADVNIREYLDLAVERVLTAKFALLDTEYYENSEMNDLLQRTKQSYGRPIQFFRDIIQILFEFIGIFTSLFLLLQLDPFLVVILTISVLPSALNNASFGKKSWDLFRERSQDIRDFHWTKGHLISEESLKELRIFNLRDYFANRAFNAYDRYFTTSLKLRNKREISNLFLGLFGTVGYAITFYLLITKVFDGAITVGLLNFYIGTSNSFAGAVNRLFMASTRIYETGLYVADIYEVLELPQKIETGTKQIKNKDKAPKIEFQNVTFVYPGTTKPVIKDLNLIIHPGEHIALVGENGAGKTTLIKLLMRFYDVTEGAILVDDVDIKDLDLSDWYSLVATLFQDYNFYHFTAYDNIGVGNVLSINDEEKIVKSAQKSGADSFIQKYENKYQQVLNKAFSGGINPSEGQKQRIALARAFFKDTHVLIMDEPTSAIDPKAEYELFEELLDFAREKTVIMISHRFSTVRNADRIIVLEDGQIAEKGTHEELMSIENGIYQTAFNLQRRGYS